jgi:hypothetical protein
MVKTSKHWCRADLGALTVDLSWTRNRDLLTDPLVRAASIEIRAVLSKHTGQMSYAKDDDVIQAFAPGTANESFANRILQGRLNRCAQYLDPSTLRNTIKFSPELAVIIANDELGPLTEWCDVPKLLGRPFRGWRTSDTNVHNALRIDIDHEEGEDWSEPDIVGLQEITGPDSMIPQESVPILTAREFRWSSLAHVSLDRTLRNSDAELQEFAAYSLGTPEGIFGSHAVNECEDFRVNSRNWGLVTSRPPTPEKPKSLSVPTKHRFRLH